MSGESRLFLTLTLDAEQELVDAYVRRHAGG
jgi:hypothetical protein